jgi:uncharacterized protein (TIGR03086 family)
LNGLDFFSAVVQRLQPADWEHPSPCSGWQARDVLGHVGTAVDFGTRLLRGEQPAWAPADPPGTAVVGDPGSWWRELVEPARSAVADADLDQVLDSPMGRRTIGEGLAFPAVDLFIHGWDLACSAGLDVDIPPEAMQFTHSIIDPVPAEQVRSARVFGQELDTSPDATPMQAFIAWTGRDPNWRPQS